MKKVLRFVIALVGLGIGCGLTALILYNFSFPGYSYAMRYTTKTPVIIAIYVIAGFLCGIIAYSVAPKLMEKIKALAHRAASMSAVDVLFGIGGLTIGLLLALLLSTLFARIPNRSLSIALSVLCYVGFGYVGWRFGSRRHTELISGFKRDRHEGVRPKILDTNILIDGRVLDIMKAGFVEGQIVVADFVLKELRHIADLSDVTKRNRGRRGLDIVKALQEEFGERISVDTTDFPDVPEVDMKLLQLAKQQQGVLVTNDFNLNKVAKVQGVTVLNINDLANAVKPVLLPGEEMELEILREGKEQGQGVGFMPDGTMVIVEGGKKCVGKTVSVTVTSALQTSAGRLIFARTCGKSRE